MEKRIYKLMDAKGRVLIPKELRVETGIGYGRLLDWLKESTISVKMGAYKSTKIKTR